MATIFPTVPVNQNQINQSGGLDALILEQFTGEVEHTFVAESVLSQFFPTKPVKGTNTLTKKAIGRTKLQKLQRGDAPTRPFGAGSGGKTGIGGFRRGFQHLSIHAVTVGSAG